MKRTALFTVLFAAALSIACAPAIQAQDPSPKAAPPHQRPGGPPPHPLLHHLDADRDGVLSDQEIQAAPAALKKLDRNADGVLTREELGPARGRRSRRDSAPVDKPPVARDAREKEILAFLEDLDTNQRRGMMNVPEEDGRLLRLLVEATGAKQVVEIGTSNGYSGIWLCLALARTGGKLTTYEIDAERAALARKNFARAGVTSLVTLVEGDAHAEVEKLKGPIDVLFLDADKAGYVDYLEKLLPKVKKGGLVVAHNMTQTRGGIAEYIDAVTKAKELETLFLHMRGAGVGVTLKKR